MMSDQNEQLQNIGEMLMSMTDNRSVEQRVEDALYPSDKTPHKEVDSFSNYADVDKDADSSFTNIQDDIKKNLSESGEYIRANEREHHERIKRQDPFRDPMKELPDSMKEKFGMSEYDQVDENGNFAPDEAYAQPGVHNPQAARVISSQIGIPAENITFGDNGEPLFYVDMNGQDRHVPLHELTAYANSEQGQDYSFNKSQEEHSSEVFNQGILQQAHNRIAQIETYMQKLSADAYNVATNPNLTPTQRQQLEAHIHQQKQGLTNEYASAQRSLQAVNEYQRDLESRQNQQRFQAVKSEIKTLIPHWKNEHFMNEDLAGMTEMLYDMGYNDQSIAENLTTQNLKEAYDVYNHSTIGKRIKAKRAKISGEPNFMGARSGDRTAINKRRITKRQDAEYRDELARTGGSIETVAKRLLQKGIS